MEKIKKVLYFDLLAAELFVSTLLMISLWDTLLYVPIAVSAIVVGLLIWRIVRYFKVTDHDAKIKILFHIAFIMLIPIAAYFLTYLGIAILFIFTFSN